MALRAVRRSAVSLRLLAIGLLLAGALGAAQWAFASMLEPANVLAMVRMIGLC